MPILTWLGGALALAAGASASGATGAANSVARLQPKDGATVQGFDSLGHPESGLVQRVCDPKNETCVFGKEAVTATDKMLMNQCKGVLDHFPIESVPEKERAQVQQNIEAASKNLQFAREVNKAVTEFRDDNYSDNTNVVGPEFNTGDIWQGKCQDEGKYKKYCDKVKYLPSSITVKKFGKEFRITPSYYIDDGTNVLKYTYTIDDNEGAKISIKPVVGSWDMSPGKEAFWGLGGLVVLLLGTIVALNAPESDRSYSAGDVALMSWALSGRSSRRGGSGFSSY